MDMWQEMNKLNEKLIKLELFFGLFISIIMLFFLPFKSSVIYFIGVIIGLSNFLLSSLATGKWLLKNKHLYIISTFSRIIIVAALILPFINNKVYVISYILGLISHYIILIYYTLSKKGSA